MTQELPYQNRLFEQKTSLKRHVGLRELLIGTVATLALLLQSPRRQKLGGYAPVAGGARRPFTPSFAEELEVTTALERDKGSGVTRAAGARKIRTMNELAESSVFLLGVRELVQKDDRALASCRQPFLHLVEDEGVRRLHGFGEGDLCLQVRFAELSPPVLVPDAVDER